MVHGDHLVRAYFEDFPAPSDVPTYSFKIHGQIYLKPVPEPSSLVLLMSGMILLIGMFRRTVSGPRNIHHDR